MNLFSLIDGSFDSLKDQRRSQSFFSNGIIKLIDGLDIIYSESVFRYLYDNDLQIVGLSIVDLFLHIERDIGGLWTPEEGFPDRYFRVEIDSISEDMALFKVFLGENEYYSSSQLITLKSPYQFCATIGSYGNGNLSLHIMEGSLSRSKCCSICGRPESNGFTDRMTPASPLFCSHCFLAEPLTSYVQNELKFDL